MDIFLTLFRGLIPHPLGLPGFALGSKSPLQNRTCDLRLATCDLFLIVAL